MPAGPRHILETQFAQLATDLEAAFTAARETARREFAEQLNQAVRRLRQAENRDELCATLADAAAQFASHTLLFRIEEGFARSPKAEVALKDTPAIASAASTKEPVVALASAGEVSAGLLEALAHDDSTRVHLFPVSAGDSSPAVVYAWENVQGAAIELLTQTAGAVWQAMPQPPVQLVSIAAATPAPPPVAPAAKSASKWEDLEPADQQVHLRAQRFARVQVAEMRLKHATDVQSGRTHRNLYQALREPIDAARQSFRAQFFTCPSMVDYLDLELTKTLAHDDPELLGDTYPGPLV